MASPTIRKRAKLVSLIVFFLSIVIVAITQSWWPGIMLALGLPLAIFQYMEGRKYDTVITLFVFVGAWLTVQFQINWEVLLPVLFSIGGIYLFFREWIENRDANNDDDEE
jgi:predicted membrane protein